MQVCTLNYTKLQLSLNGCTSLLCWSGWHYLFAGGLKVDWYVCLKYEDCMVESIKKGEVFIQL